MFEALSQYIPEFVPDSLVAESIPPTLAESVVPESLVTKSLPPTLAESVVPESIVAQLLPPTHDSFDDLIYNYIQKLPSNSSNSAARNTRQSSPH